MLLSKLWLFAEAGKRRSFVSLLLLMIIASFAEVISLGTVLPFLGVLLAPEQVFELPAVKILADYLGVSSSKGLQLPLTAIFCFAALLAGTMRLILMRKSINFSVEVGADISSSIYERTLYQPYETHSNQNSSEIINGITTKVNTIVSNVVLPVLTIISSAIMLMLVLVVLLLIDPLISLIAVIGFGFLYLSITLITRKTINKNSIKVARESSRVVKFLQEGIGGIRDILIDGNQEMYVEMYKKSDYPLKRAQGENQFIAGSPRFAMEAISMVFIAIFAYVLISQSNEAKNIIPILGTFAIAAQRMLPVLQQAYSAYTNLTGSKESFSDVMAFLDQPLPESLTKKSITSLVPFAEEITLDKIFFNYKSDNTNVLDDINIKIKKGSKVGFVGATGSGKSTLIDIIMGLLIPRKGQVLADNIPISDMNAQSWQRNIAHVPQTIFLADDTIEANIAFGVPSDEVDCHRVKKVAIDARLDTIIETWPDKYQTVVGERGGRLSGGQRQRIGIARALYKKASIIVLDEATSSLDSKTEGEIMAAVAALDKSVTILVVAHRISTLNFCDQIIEIKNGAVHKKYGSYSDYCERSVT
ncbi:ABC transporter ATP-binding protein/permease [Pseudomonadales bacterium]|nr:ABC transporter ATP-binding protein/permease [Pseudomonadales bacterium]